jgi:hypothetical protein
MRLSTASTGLAHANSGGFCKTGEGRSGYVGMRIVRPQVQSGPLAA